MRSTICPHPRAPAAGETIELAPGLFWARLPLPYRLNHVNVYLIDDGDGWAVIDAGLGDETSQQAWEHLLAGHLGGRRLTRLIVTHLHPDHIGLAGWLCRRHDMPVLCSRATYDGCHDQSTQPQEPLLSLYEQSYRSHGMEPDLARKVATLGRGYLDVVTPLPETYVPIAAGEALDIGGRTFRLITGEGHAPEQVMLYLPEGDLLLCADQVLDRITPNIGVGAPSPHADPLGDYLDSLASLAREISQDVLALPGHELPFTGLAMRCRELAAHHGERCDLIEDACVRERSVTELLPLLFRGRLDIHQTSFAFAEALAHVNHMIAQGRVRWVDAQATRLRVICA